MVYTKEEYAKAYTEILEIFKYFPEKLLKKIPKDTIKMYFDNRDKNYIYYFDSQKDFEEQEVSQLTKVLIANIFIKYWATNQEKKKIDEYDKKQFEIIENEKREKYNPNEIFNNNINRKVEDNKSLIVDEHVGFLKSILNKIKNMVKKIKNRN